MRGNRGVPVEFVENTTLLKKQRELQDQVCRYERHVEQYKVQRPKVDYIKKNVIMRDFVYDERGSAMNDIGVRT